MSYVSSDNKKSSMRLNFILLTIMSALILFTISFHIVYATIKCDTIEWIGIGGLALGVLAGMSGMGFAKATQKRYENENNTN